MKLLKRSLSGLVVAAVLCASILSTVKADAATVTLLRPGSTGYQVEELQRELKTLGFFNYWKTTGYYGTITQTAVIKFQRMYGLKVDGIAGPQTLGKIEQILNNKTALTAFNESQNPDLYWLSRIIEAEASGEPYAGKVAVGSVVINRVSRADFPNTVKGVIFDYYNGIPQFSPVADGTIYNNPSPDSINAAIDALNGAKPVQDSTYFFNPDKSAAPWIVNNKTYVARIGSHVFYK